eukprot:scaffold83146_cov36-Phaeocystis_antarctica.AAC.1
MYATAAIWDHITIPAMSAKGMGSRSSDPMRKASAVKACEAWTTAVFMLLANVLCGRRISTVRAPTT